MISAEEMAHLEGRIEGGRVANDHARIEIDAAYVRGVDDGRDSVSALPALLAGVVSGAVGMLLLLLLV